MTYNENNVPITRVRSEVHNVLVNSLCDRRVYRWRPTERLAAMIGEGLIGRERHSPAQLQHILDCVNELRRRLESAKV